MSPKATYKAKNSVETKLDDQINVFVNQIAKPLHDSRGRIGFKDLLNDKLMTIAAIHAGIPNSIFQTIRTYTSLTDQNWADILDISTKTFHRYVHNSGYRFKLTHSEKIIGMSEITLLGSEVFGSMEKMELWLNSPSFALGNRRPMELLSTSYGKELVAAELTRIDHGILA